MDKLTFLSLNCLFLMQKRRHDPVNEVLNSKYNCESRKIFGEIEIMKIRMGRDQSRVLESWLWASFYRKFLNKNHLVFSGSAQLKTA